MRSASTTNSRGGRGVEVPGYRVRPGRGGRQRGGSTTGPARRRALLPPRSSSRRGGGGAATVSALSARPVIVPRPPPLAVPRESPAVPGAEVVDQRADVE